MFTFIFKTGVKPIHIIQHVDKANAIKKLNTIMGWKYKNNWDGFSQSIACIETKYLGIKLHVGDKEMVEL